MVTDVTVLGAGNTGFAVAANLTLAGHSVTLGELPAFPEAIAPVRDSRTIELLGVAHTGAARIAQITDDVAEAAAASATLMVIVPAYGHAPWAEALAPHLRDDHTLTLMPGTLGALEVARILREAGAPPIPVAETDTAPYVCRKTGPAEATIWGVVPHLGLGVFPATATKRVHAALERFFPGIVALLDVFACGLGAMNPVVHPPGVLLNAGRIERSRGEFYFYDEGVTPGVVDAIMALDSERRAVAAALGHQLPDAAQAFHAAGFGPQRRSARPLGHHQRQPDAHRPQGARPTQHPLALRGRALRPARLVRPRHRPRRTNSRDRRRHHPRPHRPARAAGHELPHPGRSGTGRHDPRPDAELRT